jgi:hypothetical protein
MKTLQVRLPDELREEADSVLDEIGMDLSTAIRVYLKKIVLNRTVRSLLSFFRKMGPEVTVGCV